MKKFEVFVRQKHTVNTRRFIRLRLFSEINRQLAKDKHTHTQTNKQIYVF